MSPVSKFFPGIGACLLIGMTGIAWSQQSSGSGASGSTAMAQPHRHGFHRHAGWSVYGSILRQLNISAEQKSQIESILSQERPQLRSLAQAERENRAALLRTAPTDPAYAGLLTTAKSNAAARIDIASDIQRQIFGVLTPEQQGQIPGILDAQREAMKARWSARHPGSAS